MVYLDDVLSIVLKDQLSSITRIVSLMSNSDLNITSQYKTKKIIS